MAIGKTNTGGGQKTYISYAESQNTTEAQKGIALANAGAIRVYGDVSELGLSTGTATILTVWNAMGNKSLAILPNTELATTEYPVQGYSGEIEIYKDETGTSGYIAWHSKVPSSKDYKMKINADSAETNPNKPSGTWLCADNVKINISSVSSLPITVNTGSAVFVTAGMEVLSCTLSNTLAQISDWTVDTANGSVTISGSIDGTTNITLILGEV